MRTRQLRSNSRRSHAEPVANDGLGAFFTAANTRRLILAFAISIALHEAAAGLIPAQFRNPPSRSEFVTNVRIVRISMRLTPRPAPPPPPPSMPVRKKATPRLQPGVRSVVRAAPGRFENAVHKTQSVRPIWELSAGHAIVTTSLSGAGNGTGSGTGSGAGAQGNGTGAASGEEPCGFVTFSDPHGSQYDPRTRGFWVDIRMSVHFADGTSQSTVLDYPWYYASEADNPWSDRNRTDPNFPTRFQPPPGNKIENEPPLVQYVVSHSTADGMTRLRDCPQPSSSPAR